MRLVGVVLFWFWLASTALGQTPDQLLAAAKSGNCPESNFQQFKLRTSNHCEINECKKGPGWEQCMNDHWDKFQLCLKAVNAENEKIQIYNAFILQCQNKKIERDVKANKAMEEAKRNARPDPALKSSPDHAPDVAPNKKTDWSLRAKKTQQRSQKAAANRQQETDQLRQQNQDAFMENRQRAAEEQRQENEASQQQATRPVVPYQTDGQGGSSGPWYASEYCSQGIAIIENRVFTGKACAYCDPESYLGARSVDCSSEWGQREAIQRCGRSLELDSYRRGSGGQCLGQ